MSPPTQMSQERAGERGVFLATSDQYAVQGGLVPMQEGLEAARRSGGGIYLVDPLGESTDNEGLFSGLRERGIDEAVWGFTESLFADYAARAGASSSKDEL
ncbi:hypothetical protein LSUB1_G006478 [Lachnellula subtilissima]|uniref:Uncharacterized protein n=1 Tax=Lachnellula subtilissima TaxID=602034 RepID=A0A8H8RGJ3_9HELO|nr:hypothetical protein LSUB1_G006478 [Lachnellula subtilissima]